MSDRISIIQINIFNRYMPTSWLVVDDRLSNVLQPVTQAYSQKSPVQKIQAQFKAIDSKTNMFRYFQKNVQILRTNLSGKSKQFWSLHQWLVAYPIIASRFSRSSFFKVATQEVDCEGQQRLKFRLASTVLSSVHGGY